MQFQSKHTLVKLNLDSSELAQKEGDAIFIKNNSIFISQNGDSTNLSVGVRKPNLSNLKMDMAYDFPSGENKTIGAYECIELSEVYYFVWNSSGKHHIGVIDKESNVARLVYLGECLEFVNDLEYSIPETSCFLKVVYDVDASGERIIREKIFGFTDGRTDIKQINVISSMATNSYTTEYFSGKDSCCAYISAATIAPIHCIGIEYGYDASRSINYFLDKSLQFSYQYIYFDGRRSSVSPYSNPIEIGSPNCNVSEIGISNYVDLTLDVGNSFVEKIIIYKRECSSDWTIYDTISKHNISIQEQPDWWNRNGEWSDYHLDTATRTIKYRAYNDKKCDIADKNIFTNIQNEIAFAAKGLALAGDRLLLANNLRGVNNLTQAQKDNFKVSIENQQFVGGCDVPKRNITIYMKIEGNALLDCQNKNPSGSFTSTSNKPNTWFSFLWSDNNVDKKTGKYYWGGVCYDLNKAALDGGWESYNQYVPANVGGFPATINGEYTAISTQVKVTSCNDIEDIGVVSVNINGISTQNSELDQYVEDLYEGKYEIYHKWEFKDVPASFGVFRVHDPRVGLGNDYTKTSTYIKGHGSKACGLSTLQCEKHDYEWVIDVRDRDYDSFRDDGGAYIILRDLTSPQRDGGVELKNKCFENYIYDDNNKTQPNEAAYIKVGATKVIAKADHNGFVFYRLAKHSAVLGVCIPIYVQPPGLNIGVYNGLESYHSNYQVIYQNKCSEPTKTFPLIISGGTKGLSNSEKTSLNIDTDLCSRFEINGRVVDASGNPIAGVKVWTEFRNPIVTKQDGTYTIICHDDYLFSYKNRALYFGSEIGGCLVTNSDCTPIDRTPITLDAACVDCNVRAISVLDKTLKFNDNTYTSVYGRYNIGVAIWDCYGRGSFVNKIEEIEINDTESINEVSWSFSNIEKLPSHAKYVSFFATKNLNGTFFEWIADRIDFLDVNGSIVTDASSASYISFDISSLINFNTKNNFGTNTLYQFTEGDTVSIINDGEVDIPNPQIIKISGSVIDNQEISDIITITNGTNTATASSGSTNTGSKIIIPYNNGLRKLFGKCGIKIRINRPYECEDSTNGYFELCDIVKVKDGFLERTNGTLALPKIYKVKRKIVVDNCINSSSAKTFNSMFPTDFRKGCTQSGRHLIENEFAEQYWREDEIMESDSFINNGVINGFSNFRSINITNIEGKNFGGIVQMIYQRGLILLICQDDWLTLSYGQNYLQVVQGGTIEVPNDKRISNPHQKIGQVYGCSYRDKSSIKVVSENVFWVDAKNKALIKCNLQNAADISEVGGCKSFYKSQSENNNNAISGYNPLSGSIMTTYIADDKEFVNNRRFLSKSKNETLSYSTRYEIFDEILSITPEYYSQLNASDKGLVFFAFKDGQPYIHNSKDVKTFNNFFGEQVQSSVKFVCNIEPEKVKNLYNISQQIEGEAMFMDSLTTDVEFMFSYLPKNYFEKKENVYYSEFLKNMATLSDPNKPHITSKLIDGDKLYGRHITIGFTTALNDSHKYFELNNFIINLGVSEKKYSK